MCSVPELGRTAVSGLFKFSRVAVFASPLLATRVFGVVTISTAPIVTQNPGSSPPTWDLDVLISITGGESIAGELRNHGQCDRSADRETHNKPTRSPIHGVHPYYKSLADCNSHCAE